MEAKEKKIKEIKIREESFRALRNHRTTSCEETVFVITARQKGTGRRSARKASHQRENRTERKRVHRSTNRIYPRKRPRLKEAPLGPLWGRHEEIQRGNASQTPFQKDPLIAKRFQSVYI